MKYTGNTPFGLRQTDQSSSGIFSAGVERITIDANGNIGIGTTLPQSLLHINSDDPTNSAKFRISTSGGAYGQIQNHNGRTYLGTSDSSQIITLYGSNLGVKTQTPIVPLDVTGTARIRGNNTTRLDLDADVKITGQYYSNSGTEYTYLTMYNGGSASINMGTKHPLGYISFEAGSGAYTERMRITNSGNVGIGTTAPSKTLDVRGSAIISGSFSGTDANALVLDNTDSSGNPSIMRMIFSGEGGNEALQIGMYSSPTTKPVYFQSTQGSGWGNIVFQRNGGLVGIGTDSPTHKLQVAGTFKSAGINDSASAQAIFINGNGEVGIGVTNQTLALDVGGVFQFSTTSDLLQINNDTNTGGINLSGNNSRIYFGGNRAIEGAQDGGNLILGEGYSNVQVHANSAFVVNGAQTLGGNLTVSGRTDLQRDLRLRGTDANPNLGVVRMYVDANNTLFIDAANDGNNKVEINAAGDLTVPGTITAQEFRTEFITQTVIFESGSTAFGNSADDTHLFTGKLTVEQRDAGIYSGGIVDAFVIDNPLMGSTGPATRMKFTGASDTAAISSQMTTSGAGGILSFATAETSNVLTTRLKIDNNGAIGIGTDPVVGSRLKLGLRNMNGDGLLLENTVNSTEVANLYQDNGTEGILSLSNNGLERIKIRSNGASVFDGGTVGFGTQLPNSSHTVDIVGSLKVGGTGTGVGNFLTISGVNNSVNISQFDSNSGLHTFNFSTANDGLFRFLAGSSTELVRFDAQRNYFANNVGIGTLSAVAPLDIVDAFPVIRLEDPVAGAYSLLSGDGGNILIAADEGNQDGGSHIAFKTDTTERARIDSLGNFGIGTASPGAKLDVNGEIRASLFRDRDDTNYYINPSGATSAILAGKVGLGTTTPTVRLTVSENSTSFAAAITNSNSGGQGLQVTGGFGVANVLQLRSYNGFEVMRVRGDGRVGIGTSTPSTSLEVMSDNTDGQIIISRASNPDQKLYLRSGIGSGEARVASQYSLELKSGLNGDPNYDLTLATGQGEAIRIDGATNNVGIGTASPQRALDVAGDIQNNGVLRRAGLVFVKSDGVSTKIGPANATAGDVSIHSSGTLGTGDQLAVFKSSGNVGIGTTSPSYKLDVVGDVNTSGYYGIANNVVLERTASYTMLRDPNGVRKIYLGGTADQTTYINGDSHRFRDGAGGTVYMAIAPSGNVGIGTTSPTAKLHIDGDIKATSAALLGGNLQILKDLNASSLYKAGLGTTGAYGTPTLLTGYDGSTILQQRSGKQFTDIFAFGNRVISITTIGGSPKVGIGITDPTEALEVAGSVEMHSQMAGQNVSVLQKAGYNAGDPAGALMLSLDVNNNILGAFVDYTIYDDGRDNLRSGTLQVVFNGTGEVRFTDNSTTDIGDTSPTYFQAVGQAPGAEIKFVAPDPTWHVRYHVRYL